VLVDVGIVRYCVGLGRAAAVVTRDMLTSLSYRSRRSCPIDEPFFNFCPLQRGRRRTQWLMPSGDKPSATPRCPTQRANLCPSLLEWNWNALGHGREPRRGFQVQNRMGAAPFHSDGSRFPVQRQQETTAPPPGEGVTYCRTTGRLTVLVVWTTRPETQIPIFTTEESM